MLINAEDGPAHACLTQQVEKRVAIFFSSNPRGPRDKEALSWVYTYMFHEKGLQYREFKLVLRRGERLVDETSLFSLFLPFISVLIFFFSWYTQFAVIPVSIRVDHQIDVLHVMACSFNLRPEWRDRTLFFFRVPLSPLTVFSFPPCPPRLSSSNSLRYRAMVMNQRTGVTTDRSCQSLRPP